MAVVYNYKVDCIMANLGQIWPIKVVDFNENRPFLANFAIFLHYKVKNSCDHRLNCYLWWAYIAAGVYKYYVDCIMANLGHIWPIKVVDCNENRTF